ncbi:MAG TPA: extracellular solute-binding protein [Clostridia bacterium]|nr:extracellular solute-binding protein [Clostridia bacterium]
MKDTMDQMIDEFNATLGTKKGIMLNVTSISSSDTLHEKLIMAANGDPGAPILPDITTSYPKTALNLKEKDLQVDLSKQFTDKELSAYIPEFLNEGRLEEDALYVFPIAKSTEVLFINATIFNRFAQDTGVQLKDLETFEGIAKTAAIYYEWSDGKTFYMPDSLFNFAQVGYKQLGDDFLKGSKINLSSSRFSKIWRSFYDPVVLGHLPIFDGYAADLEKTGEVVCSTGSTAGVLFFPSRVTYEDNTSEPADLAILPYPTFEGGKKTVIQRGGGMCVLKSNREKEYGAVLFLKWFTSPENNLRFVAPTGYLPVTEEAFGARMSAHMENTSNDNIKKLLSTIIEMQKDYDFYIPPLFDGIDELQKEYESELKRTASESRETYLDLLKNNDSNTSLRIASEGVYEGFINAFSPN